MFRNNFLKNTVFATTMLAANSGLVYGMVKDRQREYEKLKKANPNADVVWEYQKGDGSRVSLYGGYGYASGGYKWVVKEPTPVTTPNMKR